MPADLVSVTSTLTQGLFNTSGIDDVVLHGVFIDLPVGVVTGLPTFVFKYIQAEVELYGEIKDNPALSGLYFNALTKLGAARLPLRAPQLAVTGAKAYNIVSQAVGTELGASRPSGPPGTGAARCRTSGRDR